MPLLAVLLLGACQDAIEPRRAADGDPAQFSMPPGRDRMPVIVELRSHDDRVQLIRELGEHGATVIREYELFPFLALEVGEDALRQLRRSPRVVTITEDVADSPVLDASLATINAHAARAQGWDGSGAIVAIFDTGIDALHPFVEGRVVAEACFSSNSSGLLTLCPNLSTTMKGPGAASIHAPLCINGSVNLCDHGMHVAGIAAGDGTNLNSGPLAGVAPGARIIAVQVFSRQNDAAACAPRPAPCTKSRVSDQLAAFEYVIGLYGNYPATAINMSLGGGVYLVPCDTDIRKVYIDALWSANVATVIAAGNDSLAGAVGAPGCISTAITVGATDTLDNVAAFSNSGKLLDVFAPGVGILSSIDKGTFGPMDGTSMAAPHVTGAFAVMRQKYPSLHVHQIEALLENTGVPLTYQTATGMVTTPRIDLVAALGITAPSRPPVLTMMRELTAVAEGGSASNSGTFMDPDGDPVTLSASVGTVIDSGNGNWTWSFATLDGPTQSQKVKIVGLDTHGLRDSVTFDLIVNNLSPTVQAGSDAAIASGTALAFSGSFTDAGLLDYPWKWDIAWGDGNTANGATSIHGSAITSSHRFCAAGNYIVTLSVTDKDNSAGMDVLMLSVDYFGVTIDIAPTEHANNVSLGSNGLLPVAILGTATFDASHIDVSSVTIGNEVGTDTPVALLQKGAPFTSLQDVNADGRLDMLVHFRIPDLVAYADLTAGTTQLVLRGRLADGCTNFRGADAVVVTP